MISIIMPVYNDEKYVEEAVSSVLSQSYKDFELILVDDGSTDGSLRIIKRFKDKRIRIFINKKNLGITKTRNNSIKLARGEYIFFTDTDCLADKNWLKNGLDTFKKYNCLGVEGRTFYVSKNYRKNISDKTPGDVDGENQFLGCNIAFTRKIMLKLNGYDTKYTYHDDKEFALRVLKIGKIIRCNDMIITHKKKLWTVEGYVQSGKRASDRILLYKYHNDKSFITFRVLFIRNLFKAMFPPVIIYSLIKNKPKTALEYQIVMASYIRCVYERYHIWRVAIKERIFII